MRAVVTGAAGFIGSNLTDRLLELGFDVVGVDRFSDYYAEALKRENVAAALDHDRFEFHHADLTDMDLRTLVDGADAVFHLAAQAGVRRSWGSEFDTYERDNIAATQRLLEAVAHSSSDPRFVYSSSSSVYGNATSYPTSEDDLPRPHSPYGVTKLAAEHLCALYADNLGVHTVSLRYFTVYGPRQRPDMAFHRLFEAALGGPSFTLFGDGSQIRDFTFVADAVAANVAALGDRVEPGACFNVAGGSQTSMTEVIRSIEDLVGHAVPVVREGAKLGDVRRTGGSMDRARSGLRWEPAVTLGEGLARQLEHHHRTAALAATRA